MKPNKPLVSYVMPVFNRANVIERALDGIIRERRENYSDLEIVVIDGGSTDGTVEILERYGGEIDYWISERDSGVADAFNKGIKAAQGEIIRYVASDDGIVNGFTALMVQHLVEHPGVAIAGTLANNFYVGADGIPHPDHSKPTYTAGVLDFRQTLLWTRGKRFSLIESWFMSKWVFDRVGYLDPRYRICPDYDFALRVVRAGLTFEVLPYHIVDKCFYSDGSNAVSDTEKLRREHRSLIAKHAGFSLPGLLALYNYPAPLHHRLFDALRRSPFSLWLSLIKLWKRQCPRSYGWLQQKLKSAFRHSF